MSICHPLLGQLPVSSGSILIIIALFVAIVFFGMILLVLKQYKRCPSNRVLVIYGSGHLFWLQRDVLDSADLELARFSDYAK